MGSRLSRTIRFYLTGFLMGTADLIPGVSGGTIALISGIYERLLESIRIITGPVLRLFLRGEIKQAINTAPIYFLLPLILGILTAIFTLAHLLSWLLENRPAFVWSFFFGLVLASIWFILRKVNILEAKNLLAFVLATVSFYLLVGLMPMQTSANYLNTFLGGAIAICAMILPGISGSFILLILGQYQHILNAVTNYDFVALAIFAVGCVVGLSLFVRFLSWLLAKYPAITMAFLAGIILGSIRKIWPWKEIITDSQIEKNILPAVDIAFIACIVLMIVGFASVYYLQRLGSEKGTTVNN